MDIKQLEQALSQLSGNAYPVDKWQPKHINTMDMVIKSNGQWMHEGDPITREKLMVLFSKILTKNGDAYYLVTPGEKIEIVVDDAPFVVVDYTIENKGQDDQTVWLITNIGDKVPLSAQYPLELRGEQQRPYLNLWRGLDALLSRNTYYQLIDCADENTDFESNTRLLIRSQGQVFCLGEFDNN